MGPASKSGRARRARRMPMKQNLEILAQDLRYGTRGLLAIERSR